MHAEEARALVSQALASSAARVIGRGVDLLWQLQPSAGDAELLLERLQYVLQSDPLRPETLGPWANDWVQKRLVRALFRTRVAAAYPLLQHLQDHVAARGEPVEPVERDKLNDSIREALIVLEPLSGEKTPS
jgi:hypothetical protein